MFNFNKQLRWLFVDSNFAYVKHSGMTHIKCIWSDEPFLRKQSVCNGRSGVECVWWGFAVRVRFPDFFLFCEKYSEMYYLLS
jgi:hypothetical protein